MSDRPILFSAPMVRALLEGRKTQTRRLIDFDGVENVLGFVPVGTDTQGRRVFEMKDRDGKHVSRPAAKGLVDYQFSPRIAVDDRLWVREAWRCNGWATDVATIFYAASEGDGYTAMCEQYPVAGKKPLRVTHGWRPSIHMPRWASRITLLVTDVRVERLQGISRGDSMQEGCPFPNMANGPDPRDWFCELWNDINGPNSWEANPWIVAYTFRPILGNIDQIGGQDG